MSNIIHCNIDQAKNIIKKMMLKTFDEILNGQKAANLPVMMHSSPGIGKSDSVRQIVHEMSDHFGAEFGMVDLRLASREASDVNGIPYVSYEDEKSPEMRMSTPSWFPTDEKIKEGKFPKYGIVFADELSNATMPVQHAGYRLINDRENEGGEKLPDTWVVLAAGNTKADKTGAKAIAPALANRFGVHLFVTVDTDCFVKYAVQSGWNQEIIGFVNFQPNALYTFKSGQSELAFATPRSWEKVNELLKVDWTEDELPLVLSGCVGSEVATNFMGFRKYYSKLPDFTKIMEGKESYTVPKNDVGLIYAVASALIVHMVEHVDDKTKLKNLDKVLQQLDDDYLVLVFKTVKAVSGKEALARVATTLPQTFKTVVPYIK